MRHNRQVDLEPEKSEWVTTLRARLGFGSAERSGVRVDRWCLCAARWKEASDAGKAPHVVLEATHMSTLEFASLEELQQHVIDT